MTRSLSVRLRGRPAGTLEEDEQGQLSFRYDAEWLASDDAMPLSFSLPLSEAPFADPVARAFFGGYLPESETTRDAIGRMFHVSPSNVFSLLGAIGRDCAGALSVVPPDEPVVVDADRPQRVEELDEVRLGTLLRELPTRPLFLSQRGVRLSLAGVQDKAAIVVREGRLFLPLDGTPSTHIVKPMSDRFPDIVENEHFCLALARELGLDAAHAERRVADGVEYLLVDRFDRSPLQDGHVRRIHQEDACQALSVGSDRKYEAEGGPALLDVFHLVDLTSIPAHGRLALVDLLTFNLVIGNADAHGKNFAFLHERRGSRLAPAYDLVATTIYPSLDSQMAMSIDGARTLGDLSVKRWTAFAADVGVAWPPTRRRIAELSTKSLDLCRALKTRLAAKGDTAPVYARVLLEIETRVPRLLASLS